MANEALNKELVEKSSVKVKWHGEEATRVLVRGDAEKTVVKPGGVFVVTKEQAKELLTYSHLFTLENQEPVDHPFDREQARLRKVSKEKAAAPAKPSKAKEEPKKPAEEGSEGDKVLSREEVAAFKKASDVSEVLTGMGVEHNPKAKVSELKALLAEKLEPVWKDMEAAESEEDEDEDSDEDESEEGGEGEKDASELDEDDEDEEEETKE